MRMSLTITRSGRRGAIFLLVIALIAPTVSSAGSVPASAFANPSETLIAAAGEQQGSQRAAVREEHTGGGGCRAAWIGGLGLAGAGLGWCGGIAAAGLSALSDDGEGGTFDPGQAAKVGIIVGAGVGIILGIIVGNGQCR
jgi:hypothetical protein